MARIEQPKTLRRSLQGLSDASRYLQTDLVRTRVYDLGDGYSTTTSDQWALQTYVTTLSYELLEVYAQGRCSTTGAGRYVWLTAYIDEEPIWADKLLQWGDAAGSTTNITRRTIPGSATGTDNRLGGFVNLQSDTSASANQKFMTRGEHLIQFGIESFDGGGLGRQTTSTLNDLVIVLRTTR